MTTNQIREKFIKFFGEKGHKRLPASSLVPENDPSVLFTTAGMQQFKNFYAHPEEALAKRIVTAQPCVRTTDIDEVGDETHLTLFEMLGSFSFGGDYFKQEAIEMAWEFLTDPKWLGIDKKRIYVTYFRGCKRRKIPADEESLMILEESRKSEGLIKIKPQSFGDNFWTLGFEGSPGGPTVEFYVDGVEIWNLVFNEYTIKNGKYEKSQYQGVDTGMGLERMAMVLQGKKNIFETDAFALSIEKIRNSIKILDPRTERIIADHFRAAVHLAEEGLLPSNKNQGYILRRLIRRAATYGQIFGLEKNLTEILPSCPKAKSVIDEEENKFKKTLSQGLKILDELMKSGKTVISGKEAFDLFQTYGFPFEIIKDFAKRNKIEADEQDFKREMEKHQNLSRAASAGMFKGGLAERSEIAIKYHTATHLLHAALRKILGDHVFQRGSNITNERSRFDFSHPEKLSPAEIQKIEKIVNEYIREDYPVKKEIMNLSKAKKSDALGIFDQKYSNQVSVYTIGEGQTAISKEICGGPHVERTGVLGNFKIIKEESSSAGVRRIKAVIE